MMRKAEVQHTQQLTPSSFHALVASLARAGSDSDASSGGSLSPRIAAHSKTKGQGYIDSGDEEDERDLVAQLPPRPTASSRPSSSQPAHAGPSIPFNRAMGGSGARTPLSVEGASAIAVRGGGPQSRIVEDSDTDEDLPSRRANLPSQSSQQFIQSRAPNSARGPPSQHSRGGPNFPQQDSRLYAPPNSQRYPLPPRSESLVGGAFQTGGAGASLYSAIAPSRPTPSEQHYYHHHGGGGGGEGAGNVSRPYAASSIGGRSNPGGAASVRAARPEIESALQSIQASLAAVHERLNRVESQRSNSSSIGSTVFGSNSVLGMGYQAFANAFHDIALLLGMARNGAGTAAPPSFEARGDAKAAESVAGKSVTSRGRHGKGARAGPGDSGGQGTPAWSAILRLLGAFINLSLRLALDLTSVAVVSSLLLLLVRRVTGRGDPLLLLRLIRRYSGLKQQQGVEQPKTIKLG
jgi:hypothetical protein